MRSSKIVIALVCLGVLVLLFLIGPRPQIDTAARKVSPEIPEQLSALPEWLRKKESDLGNVVPGAEKQIVWANPEQPAQTDIAVLYLHGFSASRQEIAPVPELVAKALNANIYLTRLPGHGRGTEVMTNATANDWLEGAWESWQIVSKLGRKVVVISVSTGAPLNVWLMQTQPGVQEKTVASIYVSPNFAVNNKASSMLAWPWSKHWVPWVLGREYSWEPKDELQAKYWTTRYGVKVLSQLQVLLNWAAKQDYSSIKVPLLLINNDKDKVVDPKAADRVYAAWGGYKQHVEILAPGDANSHVIIGDIMHPENNDAAVKSMLTFLEKVQNSSQ
ncbi:alpha/beta hydrolase [Gynuella sunshinyii]|uniref:alpha/beta hydrolase n=1 Tax=Gynuella sunshinyii TaxID=1445505 RepID=UPI0011870F07|nr:alpha/beta hydrolase [Gynuella sunshinyii]